MKHGWRPPAFSKRPAKADNTELLNALSDDALWWLLVRNLPEDQTYILLGHALTSDRKTAEKHAGFLAMMDLQSKGPLHPEAERLYRRLRFRALLDLRRRARLSRIDTDPSHVDDPSSMTVGEWIKAKWTSADETVRNALKTVAGAIGASIPMVRTRKPAEGAKDSGPTRRTESDQHPNQGKPEAMESPEQAEPEDHCDGPQWSDDDALGWVPCDSLHDAFHLDEDVGWF